jgi:hypothetical protein
MVPAVGPWAANIERHHIIQWLLELRGVVPDEKGIRRVTGLTTMEKAELIVDLHFWNIVAAHERTEAETQARADAIAALEGEFDGGDV